MSGFEVETFQHLARDTRLRAGDGKVLPASRDVHFQRGLDLAQVLIECPAQISQARVIHRLERNVLALAHG